MDWNQLEYFKAVAQIGNVTQAAEKLMISQSALSRSIANLERELGFPLFNRCGKNIEINANGQFFLTYVERALQEINLGRKIIEDSLNPGVGNISFAFLRSLGANVVPELLMQFRNLAPQIHFKLYENSTAFLLEQLSAGNFDLCLCPAMAAKENVEWAFLFSEEIYVAVPKNHRLAARRKVQLQEIANEPIITLKDTYGLRILIDRFFKDIGIEPLIAFEGEEIMTLAGLVAAELGVALIPRIVGINQLDIVLLPIAEPKHVREIGLAWNKKRYLSHSASRFKNFIIDYFAKR